MSFEEVVRPISTTRLSTGLKIRYTSRSDTAAIVPELRGDPGAAVLELDLALGLQHAQGVLEHHVVELGPGELTGENSGSP